MRGLGIAASIERLKYIVVNIRTRLLGNTETVCTSVPGTSVTKPLTDMRDSGYVWLGFVEAEEKPR